jgi:hypothetical protein
MVLASDPYIHRRRPRRLGDFRRGNWPMNGSTTIAHISVAAWICYGLGAQFLSLLLFDIYLAAKGQELITTAARDFNSKTGWLIAGAYVLIGIHLFALQYLIVIWHKFIAWGGW